MRNLFDFSYAKNKAHTAQLIRAFVLLDSTTQLLPKSEQPGLYRTWSKVPKTEFLMTEFLMTLLNFRLYLSSL